MQSYRRVRQHLERQRNIKRAREQEKSGGAAFRNRATRKPPRPQHLDCNLALIDIQMVIPEQLGSTEIVHGQLSFDCALPSAPRLGYSRRTSPKQPRVCQTRSLGGVQVSKLPLSLALSTGGPTPGPKSLTNIIPTSQVNYCIHSSRVVCKVGPPAAQAQGKVSNISTKSRESSPGFQVGNVVRKILWFLWSLTDPSDCAFDRFPHFLMRLKKNGRMRKQRGPACQRCSIHA